MKLALIAILFLISGFCLGQGKANPDEFIPDGYVLFEKMYGDLNQDGTTDCVLIVKGTDSTLIVPNQFEKPVDRNRRGLIILFNFDELFYPEVQNLDCFASENEDGGVYFPPDLSVEIFNGKLYVHYSHGRFGYWKYTFRYQESDFALIGYDSRSSRGPVTEEEISINFLTKKKLNKMNTFQNKEEEEEIFKSTWSSITLPKLIMLSEIKDFESLNFGN